MIRIGIAGLGFMGMIHYHAAQRLTGAKVAAIATRDRRKLTGDWTSIRGNFGPTGGQMDLSGIRCHERFESLLGDSEIDLIDICTPTQQHPEMAIAALAAGKHVLVEKPIALNLADADRMLEAAAKANRLLMVGHVLPFFPEFAYLAETVRSGRLGKLLAVQFQRIIARPDWSAAIADASQTGGPAIDLHIHDTHFIRMLFGMPSRVMASGVIENYLAAYLNTQYDFGDCGPAVACSSGALMPPGRPFVHGFEAYFQSGAVIFQSGTTPLTDYRSDGGIEQLSPSSGDPVESFANELQAAVTSITESKCCPELDGQLARDALALCEYERNSVQTKRIIEVSRR